MIIPIITMGVKKMITMIKLISLEVKKHLVIHLQNIKIKKLERY